MVSYKAVKFTCTIHTYNNCGTTSLWNLDTVANYSTTFHWNSDNFVTNSDPQCIVTFNYWLLIKSANLVSIVNGNLMHMCRLWVDKPWVNLQNLSKWVWISVNTPTCDRKYLLGIRNKEIIVPV